MNEIILHIDEIDELDEVLEVAQKIFQPNEEEKKRYHLRSLWLERINNGLLISAVINEKIVGFAVCYKKDDALHIWNVGVLEEYRKSGVWRKMYEKIVKYSIEKGYSRLTLNTYKNKFPGMYSFASKEGFVVYKTGFDELTQDTKLMFEKMISG